MPLSLKTMLKKFVYKGQITQDEYDALIKKLDGHDKEIRNNTIDEFTEKLSTDVESFVATVNGIEADLLTLDYFDEFIFDVAEQLKEEQ